MGSVQDKKLIVGLDIGTSKVVAIVGEISLDGDIEMTDALKTTMVEASPITHLTKDDPPVFLIYGSGNVPMDGNSSPKIWVNHPLLGIKLKEAMEPMGSECHLQYKGGPAMSAYDNSTDFLRSKLLGKW